MRSFRECIGADNVGLAFEFQDLSFEPKPGKTILSGISGVMQSGSFWAVMGGSGAGKSTFLNVLMGKTKHTGGSVLVNGHQEKMKKYKKLIGYVPQDDIVLPELTVRENILHSARIRLPSNWSDEQIQEHVDTLIACLGLSHVSDSLVGDTRKPVISRWTKEASKYRAGTCGSSHGALLGRTDIRTRRDLCSICDGTVEVYLPSWSYYHCNYPSTTAGGL